MKKIISLGIAFALALFMLAGCSAQPEKSDQSADVDQTPAIGFDQSVETSVDLTPVESLEDTSSAAETGGRMMINFEGRVTQVEGGRVTLDSGKTVFIGGDTIVVDQDGAAAEIAVDDFIQGYAADPDAPELEAVRILVSAL